MMRFLEWLKDKMWRDDAMSNLTLGDTGSYPKQPAPPNTRAAGHTISRATGRRPALPKRQPDVVNIDTHVEGRIENRGPGKNVLVRNKYVREDSGTHDTLRIVDDSDSGREPEEREGFDPYNTGQYDRSKNWDRRR